MALLEVEVEEGKRIDSESDFIVFDPSFGFITIEVKGGAAEAQKFIDNLEIFSLLANVADVKSLVIHPASTTHSQLNEEELAEQGIRPNTVRLSIGTEHIDDLIADISQALEKI